jgi:two-component system, cell cycle sensor histidine kinase and response regulator CckA
MASSRQVPDSSRRLSNAAEEKAVKQTADLADVPSAGESKCTISGPRIPTIELSMQNTPSYRTKASLKDSRARYFDLFDFAPAGSLTLNSNEIILPGPLKTAGLVRIENSPRAKGRFCVSTERRRRYSSES